MNKREREFDDCVWYEKKTRKSLKSYSELSNFFRRRDEGGGLSCKIMLLNLP